MHVHVDKYIFSIKHSGHHFLFPHLCVQISSHVTFGNSTINERTAMGLFSKASCPRSPPHEPTTAPPIPCVPSSPGKLHNTAHATKRRRVPPSSMPTRPFRTNPARLILTPPRKIFHTPHGTRITPPLSRCQRWPTEPYAPPAQTTLPPPSGPAATHANPLYTKPQAERATARWAPPITPQSQAQVPFSLAFPTRTPEEKELHRCAHTIPPPRPASSPARSRRQPLAAEELRAAWRPLVWETLPNFSDRVVVAVFRREESFFFFKKRGSPLRHWPGLSESSLFGGG
jgi:hypothetical protein